MKLLQVCGLLLVCVFSMYMAHANDIASDPGRFTIVSWGFIRFLKSRLWSSKEVAVITNQNRIFKSCEDTAECFEVVEPGGKTKMKGCDWVQQMKTNWR